MSFDLPARFSQPHESPSPDSGECEENCCRCCRAREKALELTWWDHGPEWGSPLTPGILSDNIAIGHREGSVRVDLWREWPRMLIGLREIGPVLTMTRNSSAALGIWRQYPDLEWMDSRASDDQGEFDFDLRYWARAYARHQRGNEGHIFAAEFHDHDGVCFHRVCLINDSSLEGFTEWARVHQAVKAVNPPPPPQDDPLPEPIGAGGWRNASPGTFTHLLQECLDRELPVRAIVGCAAATQAHRFVPRKLSTFDGWTYCHGDEVALHFLPENIADVRLHDLGSAEAPCWTLRAYDFAGALVLMLLPGASERLPMWNFLASKLG